jgi:hypothetical protein
MKWYGKYVREACWNGNDMENMEELQVE